MRWLRLINNSHRQAREHGLRMFVILVSWIYLWSAAPCAGGGQIFPDLHSLRKSRDPCENYLRRSLGPIELFDPNDGRLRTLLVQDYIIPRLSAAALLRDNLLTSLGQILLRCLDEETRVSFERLHDALRSRHIPVYDILPILPIIRGKSVKHQIYTVLQIIERIGSPFVAGYASMAKTFVYNDGIELNSMIPNDLLLFIDNQTITAISLDKERKLEVPMTEEEAFVEMMNNLRNRQMSIELSTVSALMVNIPNFDTTNPEVPETMRFVASYMNEKSKIDDPLLDFLTIDQLDGPDVLVKAVLERIEVYELSSEVLRESVGILLQSFDTKPWDRGMKLSWARHEFAKNIFDAIAPDYYPSAIVAIAKHLKQYLHLKNSLNIESTYYDSDKEVMIEFLTRLLKREEFPEKMYKLMKTLQSFLSQKNMNDNDFLAMKKPVGFDEVLKHLSTFEISCVSRKLIEAAENLRPLLTDDLPWSFAYGAETSSENPWKLMVNALVNLRNTPVPRELAVAIDNLIFQVQSSRLIGKSRVLYEDAIIFQRPDSSDVELDMYSLLSRLPNVFNDNRFTPLLVFATKTNLLDYLGHEFNKFEHVEPRQLLLVLLKRALAISAVRATKPLLRALNIAKDHLEKPLLINLYTSEELQRLLEILPKVHEDPRYIPLKIMFKKKNLFSHLSLNFSLANLNSPVQHIKHILSTVALKPIEIPLAESINFALSNVEGPPLPVRAFNRQDFVYLVNHLLSHSNYSRVAILQSPVYIDVADWHPALRGSPEIVLARILNYPVEVLSDNLELAKIIRDAEASLGKETATEVDLLKRKTLNAMLDEFPDELDFRVTKLLFKKADLAIFVPKLNVTKLDDLAPRGAWKELSQHLTASPYLKSENFLSERMISALKASEKSGKSSGKHDTLASYLNEMLIDPFDPKFEPLMRELRKERYHKIALSEKLQTLRNSLYKFRDKSRTSSVRRAARVALAQVFPDENDYSPKKRRISKTKINYVLNLLPKQAELDPLRKLLTVDWIRGVLPGGLRASKFRKPAQLLRAVLTSTKDNCHVRENSLIIRTISLAEQALGGWTPDVTALRQIIVTVEAVIYEPVMELLTAKNLNKLNLTFEVNPRSSTKRTLLDLLDRVLSHSRVQRDNKVLELVESVKRDVITFGVDIDLLSVLDDVGVDYEPELTPLRVFLHRDDVAQELGPVIFGYYDPKKRFAILLRLLEESREVRSDEALRKAVKILKSVDTSAKKPLDTAVADLIDILNTIPSNIKVKYPEVQELFTTNILERIAEDDDILRSQEPLMALLIKLSHFPDTLRNYSVATKLAAMYEEIDNLVKMPFVTSFQMRPLVRELHHIQQTKIDFVDKLVKPEVPFVNVTDPSDNIAALNALIEIALLKSRVQSDPGFKNSLLFFQKDLELVAGPRKASKGELTYAMIGRIINLIPPGVVYDPIRFMIESRETFKYIREITNWQRYPSAREKLDVILTLIENTIPYNHQLERSLVELRRYLASQFDFVSKEELKLVKHELYGVAGNVDLVPLKLFVTHENLVKYLPKNFNYSSHRLPSEALFDILDILRQVPSLKRRKSLYEAMTNAEQILHENQLIYRSGVGRKSANSRPLTPYDVRFVLALKVGDSGLKGFLDPKKLIRLLPNDFELSEQTTFKEKSLRLLRQLMKGNKKFRKRLKQLVQQVESLPDVPWITDEELRPLIDIIPRETSPNFASIRKLLRATTLTQLFPGNFNIRSFDNSKLALREILKILELTINGNNKSLEKSISTLRKELRKKKSKILRQRPRISLEELRSLIAEIPFDKHVALREMKKNFTEDNILSLLPREYDVYQFATKKSRLMGILEAIVATSVSGELEEPIKIILNLISIMPDAPRIHDADIKKALSAIPLSRDDLKAIRAYCTVEKLGARLPIDFDISRYKSRKNKISVLLRYCKETKPRKDYIKKALSNAMALEKKLPTADLTNLKVNQILDQINCGNFSSTKPLKFFLSKVDIVPHLPWNLNLESQSTFKLRTESLLKALLKVRELNSKKYIKALKHYQSMVKNMPNRVEISKNNVTALRNLAVMQDARSKLCAEYLTLPNVLKVIPPSFDIKKFPNDESRLSALLLHFNNTQQIRSDQAVYDSCKFVDRTLSRQVENTIFDRLNDLVNDTEEYLPLKLFLLSNEDTFFDAISVPRGYENENLNDTLRITLRSLLNSGKVLRSKTLGDSIVSILGTLPNFVITKFDVDEAIAEIPKSNKYENLTILLRCPDVTSNLYKSPSVPSDYTPKQVLLEILSNLHDSSLLDRETVSDVEELRKDLKREIWDHEAEEMFKQLKDHDTHIGKLEAIRAFFIAEGPEKILGHDYREKYPNKLDRLKALCEKLMALPDQTKKDELRRSLEYLIRVLENHVPVTRRSLRSIIDIDIKSLLAALPKTRNERIILGLLKFFSNPRLLRDIELKKNPYDYKSKGALLQAIVRKGRSLRSVKRDRLQLESLEYFKDKIITNGRGGEPIELKNYARNSNLDVDMIGLLKALDLNVVNATVALKIAVFFDKEYDKLLHGLGFDQAAYHTRGSYLKAFLRHLIGNTAVPSEVRLNAKLLLPAVTLKGFGAEPVDVNEGIVPDNRMFVDQPVPGWNSQLQQFSVVHPWNLPATSTPMHPNDVQLPGTFESNRAMLKASVNKILQSQPAVPQENPYYHRPENSFYPNLQHKHSAMSLRRNKLVMPKNLKIVESATTEETEMPEDPKSESREAINEKERELTSDIRRSLRRLSTMIVGSPQPVSNIESPSLKEDFRSTKSKSDQASIKPVSFKTGTIRPDSEERSAGIEKRRALADEEIENATFHPDEILFEPGDRMMIGPEMAIATEDTKHIISMDEADKASKGKKKPVTSLKIHPDKVLKMMVHSKTIPHRLSKNPKSVNLETRKLFIREDNEKKSHVKRRVRRFLRNIQ